VCGTELGGIEWILFVIESDVNNNVAVNLRGLAQAKTRKAVLAYLPTHFTDLGSPILAVCDLR
jgi:hypothetical protein